MKDLQIIYRLLIYSFRYWKHFLLLLFVALLGVGIEVAKPLPLKIIIDNVLANRTLSALLAQLFENSIALLNRLANFCFYNWIFRGSSGFADNS